VCQNKIVVKNCMHGKGVFASQDIISGESVLRFEGPVVRAEDLPNPYGAEKDYFLQIDQDLFVGPSGKPDDYVNHSCDPNCGIIIDTGTLELVAIRPIPACCHITFDYSTTMHGFWWEMDCHCGSETCRGKVENFVELSKDIQSRYIRLGVVPRFILQGLREN